MSNGQKPTKNQHYVPQWYLRMFSDCDGRVYFGHKDVWVKPDTIFFQKYLYELDDVPENEMEHILKNIVETEDSRFIRSFVSRLENMSDISDFSLTFDDKLSLYKFMMSMLYRHPDSLRSLSPMSSDLVEAVKDVICSIGLPDYAAQYLCGLVNENTATQVIRNHHFGGRRDEVYTLDTIQKYGVVIFKACGDLHFVASNRPVCVICGGHFRIVPLSPRYAVAFMSIDMLPKAAPIHYFNPISDEHVLGLQRIMYHGWSPNIVSDSEDSYRALMSILL